MNMKAWGARMGPRVAPTLFPLKLMLPVAMLSLISGGPGNFVLGGGPGTYGHFDYPRTYLKEKGATEMAVYNVWTTVPNKTETRGNAVFAATQTFWQGGASGYVGTQVWRNSDGTMVYKAIFSVWDAEPQKARNSWSTKTPWCQRFGGEGVGVQCLINYTIKKNSKNKLRLYYDGKNSTGAFWTATIHVEGATKKTSTKAVTIGTIFLPNWMGYTGSGNLQVSNHTCPPRVHNLLHACM